MRRTLVSLAIVLMLAALAGFVAYRRGARLPDWGSESGSVAGSGSDTVTGSGSTGSGSDTVTGSGSDTVTGSGSDTVTGSGSDTVTGSGSDPVTGSGSDPVTGSGSDPVTVPDTVTAPVPVPAAPPAPLLDRPLRVVTTRWEIAAPILLAAGGATSVDGSALDRQHLRQELSVLPRASQIEEALARGGAAAGGADLAIVPLATWISSYEHLAALSTEVFFVAAWSRGSEAFFISADTDPSRRVPQSFGIAGERTSAESLSALLLLHEMGASLERIRFLSSDAPEALVATAEREGTDAELRARGRVPWMTTADASRLSPWVVIAPRGFVREHQPVLVGWTSAWLDGMEALSRDVPAAARTLAALPGAPPLVDLLRRLGQVEPVGLVDQAQLAGLSGRSYVTLESLFTRGWAAERALGVLSGPPPETLPIATGTIATLVRRDAPSAIPAPAFRANEGASRPLATFPFDPPRSARDTEGVDRLVVRLGFVAGVFPRSGLRLSAPRDRAAAIRSIVERAVEQYGLDAARVEVTTGADTSLRVLPPA